MPSMSFPYRLRETDGAPRLPLTPQHTARASLLGALEVLEAAERRMELLRRQLPVVRARARAGWLRAERSSHLSHLRRARARLATAKAFADEARAELLALNKARAHDMPEGEELWQLVEANLALASDGSWRAEARR